MKNSKSGLWTGTLLALSALAALSWAQPARAEAPASSASPASAAQTPLSGAALGYWQSDLWVTGQFGNYFQDPSINAFGSKAISGKAADGTYYIFGVNPIGAPGGKYEVVLYETACDFFQFIGDAASDCSKKGWLSFKATDTGVLTQASAHLGGASTGGIGDRDLQAEFVKMRAAWSTLDSAKALFASTLTQEQLDKIFGPGVVHPQP